MAYRGERNKNGWALFLLILAGIVLFGFLGSRVQNIDLLKWLNYSVDLYVGKEAPISIDLYVISFSFRFIFRVSVAGVFGTALGIFVYRKI